MRNQTMDTVRTSTSRVHYLKQQNALIVMSPKQYHTCQLMCNEHNILFLLFHGNKYKLRM